MKKLRNPAAAVVGNLMWTRYGTVWAMWRIEPLAYGFRPVKDKKKARTLHTALFRNLPSEALLLGVCAEVDPTAVVERMIEGIDLDAHPDWAEECAASLDTLDEIGVGQRVYWLACPLATPGVGGQLWESIRSAMTQMGDSAGAPIERPSEKEIERRSKQAGEIQANIPALFRPQPASAAQMIWLDLHAQSRGLFADALLPSTNPTDPAAQMLLPKTGAAFPEPLLDEGGRTDAFDENKKKVGVWNPLARRFVKVVQPNRAGTEPVASYQAMLVVSDVPDNGTVFPGSEILGRIDESGLEVDWAIRLATKSGDEVAKKNRAALRDLNEQFVQRQDEMSHALNMLDRRAEELAEYVSIFESDKMEVESQPVIVFATAGPTPELALENSRALAEFLADTDYKVQQPLGLQMALWWAMIPGTPLTRQIRDFAQIIPAKQLATLVPFASTELGDTKGSLLAVNISTGRPGVVMHDIKGASLRDQSGSIGLTGDLGSGKSVGQKTLCGDAIDRGGQVVVVDRTQMGEWALWAESVTNAVIVDVENPAWSMDPLRLYGPRTGAGIAQSFLTPLLNLEPTSDLGVLLADVIDGSYLSEHQLTGLGDVVEHLATACTMTGAEELARKMRVFARRDYGAVIFDNSLPPLPTDSAGIVVRTHTLELPSVDEIGKEHLFRQMRLEKVFGRAYYALVAGLARAICFADRTRLGVFDLDETHHVTASPEGEREIIEFVRDGRKHQAAAILGSHDPQDFGSDVLRGLIPTRIAMRQTDRTLAQRSLEWLGVDPTDEELVETLMNDTSPLSGNGVPADRRGEAFLRDAHGRIGRIKVLAPAVASRREAALTSPPDAAAAAAGMEL